MKDSGGLITGPHVHICVNKGKTNAGISWLSGDVLPSDAFFIKSSTNIQDTCGYTWIKLGESKLEVTDRLVHDFRVYIPANYVLRNYRSETGTVTETKDQVNAQKNAYVLPCNERIKLSDGSVRYKWISGDTPPKTLYFKYDPSVMSVESVHDYNSITMTPTCTQQGYTYYYCSCGDEYYDDYTSPTGHNFVSGVCSECGARDPDYNADGFYVDENGIRYTMKSGVLTVSGDGECSKAWKDYFDRDTVKKIIIEDGVTSICNYAFADCTSLESVTIPDSVTSIGISAFRFCTSLANITIPDGVKNLGTAAFSGTAYYNDEANWENGVLYIGAYLIAANDDVSGAYKVKNGTQSFGEYGMAYTAIESVEIPASVAKIAYGTFRSCASLKSVTLPATLQRIDDKAFEYCESLTDVYFGGTQAQWDAISIGDKNECLTNAAIHCAKQHVHSYTDIVTKPTCTEKGYTTHTCACGESFVDSYVNALGHDTEIKNAKAASCTDKGYTGDEVCKTCGETVKTGSEIDAKGHEYRDGECIRCGDADPNAGKPTENPFTDVTSEKYFYAPVMWAVNHDPQITGGYTDGTFRPQNTCTRAQIVTFIWRAKGCPEPASNTCTFTDVAPGAYYYKAVLWAVENGITGVYNEYTFGSNDTVTRAQAMTFLWRAAGKPAAPAGTVNTFTDVSSTSYYYEAVLWAVASGVTGGYDANTFGSNDGCTRGQIVTFLYRSMA